MKRVVFFFVLALLLFSGPRVALAIDTQGDCPSPDMIDTALGCIQVKSGGNLDPNAFIGWAVENIIYIASGVAFILMAVGAILVLTSRGDPKQVKAGTELINAALSGLIFVILSLFILKLIGVDILRLPGFAQ